MSRRDSAGREKSLRSRGKMETNDEIEELALDKRRENRSTMVTGDNAKKRCIRYTKGTYQVLFWIFFFFSGKYKAKLRLRNGEIVEVWEKAEV